MKTTSLLVKIMVASCFLVTTGSITDATERVPVPPACPLLGDVKGLEVVPFVSGDNPPTTFFTWSGRGGVVVDVVGDTVQSGTFNISGIPSGASIVWAYMYEASWEQAPTSTASATFAGNSLPSVLPFDHDSSWGGTTFYDLCAYRWDVTPYVYGNGSYPYVVSRLDRTYGEALVVIYSHPSEPARRIVVNDGAESLLNASSTSEFAGVAPDSATLFMFTQADDWSGHAELISFNGTVVLGPGNVFNMNRGYAASLIEVPVQCVSGANTVVCSTGVDWFGWHLAVLEGCGMGDLITGGGWIPGELPGPGSKRTFGFNARSEAGGVWGQLQFNDHATKMRVHSDTVKTLVVQPGDTVANFSGDCRVDGVNGYAFDCEVMDRGEPGHHLDWFSLNISGPGGFSYFAGDYLGGGNIQIHLPTDSDLGGGGPGSEVQPRGVLNPLAGVDSGIQTAHVGPGLLYNAPNPFSHSTTITYRLPPRHGDAETGRGGEGSHIADPVEGRGPNGTLRPTSHIALAVYDLSGRLVRTLVDEEKQPGYYSVGWDGKNTAGENVVSGIYFYRLRAGRSTSTKKMTLLR